MYLVKLRNRDGSECVLHDPRDPELLLINPSLSLELNKSGAFSFSISPNHPHIGDIKKMSSEIEVLRDGETLYVGRPLNEADDMDNVAAITCEGVLAYLLDSIVRPFTFQGSPAGLFQQLLSGHNAQVDERKHFKLGTVTVTDSNNYINRSNSGYSTTWEAINVKLVKTHGGYLRVRFEPDGRYLDYLADYDHTCSQVIQFGENLLDLNKYIDPDDLVTAIIPLGAETDEDGINGVKKRVNITSVNGGEDYLVDEAAAAEFGFICRTVQFDDVTLPQNLKTKGLAYLNEHKALIHSLELSAVDLHLLDVNTESVSLGDWIRVKSSPHGLDSLFLVSKLELDLADPGADTLSLGKTFDTMTSTTGKIQNDAMSELQSISDGISARLVVADQSILAEVARATAAENDLDADLSSLRVDIKGITFSVSNGSTSSHFTMTVGDTTITSPEIKFDGVVNFINNSLGEVGSTDINGGNITTGIINTDQVQLKGDGGGFTTGIGSSDGTTTHGAKIYAENLEDENYVFVSNAGAIMTVGSPGIYGGGSSLSCVNSKITATTKEFIADGNCVVNGTLKSASGTVEKSDRNLKQSISHGLEAYRAFFLALRPATYRFKSGTSGRFHIGFIAQEVEDALTETGLTTQDFAGLVIDTYKNENNEEVSEYGLRYSDFVALNTEMIQQALQKIEALEKRIEKLEGQAHGENRQLGQ